MDAVVLESTLMLCLFVNRYRLERLDELLEAITRSFVGYWTECV